MRIPSLVLILALVLAGPTFLFSQEESIQLRGSLSECEGDSLLFFQLNGNKIEILGQLPLQGEEDPKTLAVNLPGDLDKGFYFVGEGRPQNSRVLLLNGESMIQLQGSCPTLAQAQVASKSNQALGLALEQSKAFNARANKLFTSYRRAQATRTPTDQLDSMILALDQEKLDHFREVKEDFPLVAKVLGTQTYLSYPGYGKDKAEDEAHYFAEHYFQLVDLSDPFFNQNPYLQDAFANYARSLGNLGLSMEEQTQYISDHLSQLEESGERAHKAGLLGLINGFQRGNEDMYVKMGSLYLQRYEADNPGFASELSKKIEPLRNRAIGAVAPEIVLPNPEGDTLSLSSLRGKYVLIDFWASWCGPCRRENPAVRKVYEKYRGEGFEILGVSLDRSKASWEKAIEQDKLEWLHVSDLKYWSSTAARTYGVHSIPFTVLVGPDGKIIEKKLRGAALEARLAEIFDQQ